MSNRESERPLLDSLLKTRNMQSPFTIEEKEFARNIKRLANGVERLIQLLEESDITKNQDNYDVPRL